MSDKAYIVCKTYTGMEHEILDTDILGVYTSKEDALYNMNLFKLNFDVKLIEKELNEKSLISDVYFYFKILLNQDLYPKYRMSYLTTDSAYNDIEPNKATFIDLEDCKLRYIVRLHDFDTTQTKEELEAEAKSILLRDTNETITSLRKMIESTVIYFNISQTENNELSLLRNTTGETDSATEDAITIMNLLLAKFNRELIYEFEDKLSSFINTKFSKNSKIQILDILQTTLQERFPKEIGRDKSLSKLFKRFITNYKFKFFHNDEDEY